MYKVYYKHGESTGQHWDENQDGRSHLHPSRVPVYMCTCFPVYLILSSSAAISATATVPAAAITTAPAPVTAWATTTGPSAAGFTLVFLARLFSSPAFEHRLA